MAIKPKGEMVHIKEQIIEDLVSGLTFLFEKCTDGGSKLIIYGAALPYGNREIFFDSKTRLRTTPHETARRSLRCRAGAPLSLSPASIGRLLRTRA